MRYLSLVVITFLSVVFIDIIKNKLGIMEAFIWGILAVLWSRLCLELSRNKSIKLEKLFYKVGFYVLLISGSYILILGIIDLIKRK